MHGDCLRRAAACAKEFRVGFLKERRPAACYGYQNISEDQPMPLFSLAELEATREFVAKFVPPTPTHAWPLLKARTGVNIYVKHENHTPAGAFKVRGGVVYLNGLKAKGALPRGVVSATRGNHGQSIAFAARHFGIASVIVVPEGNSLEKNAAMKAFGAELVIAGKDFDESRQTAAKIAEERGFHFVPSFHADLVKGVATYGYELFKAAPALKAVYVPIGLGSGICSLITVRDLLGLDTEIVGVVSENADCHALSFERGEIVRTNSARTFADGMATRDPNAEAFAIMKAGAARIIRLSDDEIAEAVRAYYVDTHNVAEGAGAAPLAGLMKERDKYQGENVGVILCGGNIDAPWFADILQGRTPRV
jgi:threonine dehydratase